MEQYKETTVASFKHIKSLDGLRGIAILLVMVFHQIVVEGATDFDRAFLGLFDFGWCGVDLFFVLSGFLITGILLDTRQEVGYFKKFYARRFLRIFPIYYALLAFSLLILPMFDHPKVANFGRIGGDEFYYIVYLQNFAIAMANTFRHGILDVTWSLAIEEQFYIVWPFVVILFSRKSLLKFCGILFISSFLIRSVYLLMDGFSLPAYVLTPMRLEGLVAGAGVAAIIRTISLNSRVVKINYILLGVCSMSVVLLWGGTGGAWNSLVMQTVGYSIVSLAFASLLLLIVYKSLSGRRQPILESRILCELGKYSYAIYLFHLPIRAVFRDVLFKPEDFFTFFGSVVPAQFVFVLMSSVVTFIAAMLSWNLFEKHFLRLKKYYSYESRG